MLQRCASSLLMKSNYVLGSINTYGSLMRRIVYNTNHHHHHNQYYTSIKSFNNSNIINNWRQFRWSFLPKSATSSTTSAAAAAAAAATTIVAPKSVAYTLLLTSGLVFTMVVVGGATRLTQSGLSMKFTGEKWPRSQQDWEETFEKYKQYPEFIKKNYDMTVDEFKNIFYFEYGHRMLGRVIGVVYGLPMIYFAWKGYLKGPLATRTIGLMVMGGLQGLLGWYMVKSGLDEKTIIGETPSVSPYRLASHLLSAFVIYGVSFWTALDILRPKPMEVTDPQIIKNLSKLKRMTRVAAVLLIIAITSGAFVAGLDAGYIYNTFPLMGNHIIPEDYWHLSPNYKNITENPAAVQFNHRYLALATAGHLFGTFAVSRRVGKSILLPPTIKRAYAVLAGITTLQVSLGITALLTHVPVPVGVAHQSGSLLLLTSTLYCLHVIRFIAK